MANEEIISLLKNLNWNNPIEIQDQAMKQLSKLKNLNIFMQPIEPVAKPIWENCAKILYQKSDLELLPYTSGLFTWIQDLNWPGAIIIFKRLQIFSKELLRESYEMNLEIAKKTNDKIWVLNIQELYNKNEDLERCIKETFSLIDFDVKVSKK